MSDCFFDRAGELLMVSYETLNPLLKGVASKASPSRERETASGGLELLWGFGVYRVFIRDGRVS